MLNLVNKRILFIGPKTFNYEIEIIEALIKLGAKVDYYDERPSSNFVSKILYRTAPVFMTKLIGSYYENILDKTDDIQYDFVFCIKLEVCPRSVIEKLRQQQNNAIFLFYTWDSMLNNPNPLRFLDLFNRVFTFDSSDALKYNLIHRPLFYIDSYKIEIQNNLEYDVSFIGSVHTKRYRLLKSFIDNTNNKFNCFIYLYVPNYLIFWLRKLFLFHVYGRSKKRDFNFVPLPSKTIMEVFTKSRAILDIAHHNQNGLTMRTIEAIGAKKKIITNNKNIVNYDFYNPENIFIVDKENMNIPTIFLEREYTPLPVETYSRYSIKGWISEIFNSK